MKHRPFHSYTMKQAVEEGFILDVLKSYTPVDSYYKVRQEDRRRPGVRHQAGAKKLRRYVESHDSRDPAQGRDHGRITSTTRCMAPGKIGGQARQWW